MNPTKHSSILSFQRHKLEAWLAIFAFICLLILTLSYLLSIGYTTSDDVQIARQDFSETFNNAIKAGRLTWVLAIPSSLVSEIQGSIWYSKLLRIFWVLTLFHGAYLLLRGVITIKPALLVLIFPVIFFINDWDHHAFSSYPGLTIYAMSCFFYSLHCFNKYLVGRNRVFLLLSVGLFLLSFVTELFPTLFVLLILYPLGTLKGRIRGAIFHFITLLVFAYSYYQFKAQIPSYSLSVSLLALKTWAVYSYSQIYTISEIYLINFNYLNIEFYAKFTTSVAFILVIIFINYSEIKNYNYLSISYFKNILWWILISAWVNIPVALTINYQEWVSRGSMAYLYSAVSNFTASIAIGLIFTVLINKVYRYRFIIIILTSLILSIFTINGIKSYNTYLQQKYSHDRWVYVDILAKRNLFRSDVCYVAPWLFDLNWIVGIRTDDYWDMYLLQNWGIKTRILKDDMKIPCEKKEVLSDPRKKPA